MGQRDLPSVAHDLPPEKFPFTVTAFGFDRKIVWVRCIKEGPAVLHVPGGGPGTVTRVVIVYGDDTYTDYEPGS